MKIFNWDGRKGTLIDSVSKTAGTLIKGTGGFKVTEKGKAMKFDGADTKIDTGLAHADLDLTGDITIVAYINPHDWGEALSGLAGDIINNDKLIFGVWNTGDVLFLTSDASTTVSSATNSIDLNKYQFVIATRTSTGLTNFYVDNSLSGTADQSSGTPVAGTTNMAIGNNITQTRTFDGFIPRIIIYNHILTSQERDKAYEEFLHSYNLSKPKTGFVTHKPTNLSGEVNNTVSENFTDNYDFTNGWSVTSGTILSSNSFSTTSAGGLQKPYLTIGKKYRVTYSANTTSTTTINVGVSSVCANNSTADFTATDTKIYVRNGGAGTTTVNTLIFQELTGLVAAYNFIPSNGKLVDISGNHNDGTITGTLSTKDGMKFDGLADVIINDNGALSPTTEDYSWYFRYNTEVVQVGFNRRILGGVVGSNGFELYLTNKIELRVYTTVGNEQQVLSDTLQIDTDYAICISKIGKVYTLYLNGIAQPSVTFTNDILATSVDTVIGLSGNGTFGTEGIIKDLKFYNYARTAQQAVDYHNSFIKVITLDDFSTDPVGSNNPEGWQ